jgi:two-component system, chemotaxis family, protein-glutamate methylesterase/glutaminase
VNRPLAQAIVIGTSAGGVEALSAILPALPKDYPLPVMTVIHLPLNKNSVVAELFQSKCNVPVKEAEDKEPIRPGTVYFAPPDYHLLVETDGLLSLSSEETVHYSRPSIDVLFESAADTYGAGLIGIVLTGANDDGAAGLLFIHEQGGTALVQTPVDAQAPAMPWAALNACPQARPMSLQEIAAFLLEVVAPL